MFMMGRLVGSSSGNNVPTTAAVPALLVVFARTASAHGGHGSMKIPEGQTISADSLDTIMWTHIFLQMFTYGVLFPIGMVLGMIKSRFHVPCQVAATALALLGAVLGHAHKGREFVESNAHALFATPLQLILLVQLAFGVYLRMHLERGVNGWIRPVVRLAHSVLGKVFPVLSWAEMLFGGITALGFCQGDHVGQCAAHFIMGSAFIAYATVLTIMLVAGQAWLARTGRSQEFFDSVVITAWGCVNTFTEHHWGTEWVKNDWQHTSMGIMWWCAGLAGIWLSKDRGGGPQRNFVPGFVLVLTGWAFGAHPQELVISAKVHTMFGYALMAAGLSRIVEVAFVLRDRPSGEGRVSSWQYVPIFMLFASGFMFMGATDEQMNLVALGELDHVSYTLVMYSMAFLVFLHVNMLVSLYHGSGAAGAPDGADATPAYSAGPGGGGGVGGGMMAGPGHSRIADAEEFELDGLTSDDDEDEERGLVGKDENGGGSSTDEGMASPSTVGRNELGRVR